jgi:hypothetical protein
MGSAVERGNLNIRFENDFNDEIGQLGQIYQDYRDYSDYGRKAIDTMGRF